MPVITIEILPQEYAKKVEIAKVFTNEISRITGIPQESVVVLIHDYSPENVATGGELLIKKINMAKLKKD